MEPTSSTGLGIIGGKWLIAALATGGVSAALAATVVFCLTTPKTAKEWAVALITTFVSSVSLGSGMVLWLNLHLHLNSDNPTQVFAALMAIGGCMFASGLPGWALVRALFNSITARNGQTLEQVFIDLKELKD